MTKTCPGCNSQVDARRVNCPQCNRRLAGSAEHPENDAEGAGLARKSKFREDIVLSGLALLTVGFLFYLLFHAVGSGPVSMRSHSKNNFRQIGIGLHNYHEVYETLPAGGDNEGDVGFHSWMTLLLPQVDHMSLYNQVNFSVPFDNPRNAGLFTTPIAGYINPASERAPDPLWFALTDYTANEKVLGRHVSLRLDDITDGLANTVLAGEIRGNSPPWGSPENSRDLMLGINREPQGFGSPHKGGAHFLMADGAVRFVSDSTSIDILSKLAHPTDGLEVGEY